MRLYRWGMRGEFIEDVVERATGLFGGIPPEDADDIRQEMALKLWERRELVEGADDPAGFGFIVAKNAGIDWIRREMSWRDRRVLLSELEQGGV